MFNAFVTLFLEASVWYYLLMLLAILVFSSSVFVSNFTLPSMIGVIITIGAITVRCTTSNNTETEMFFYIVYSILLIVLIVSIIRFIFRMNRVRREKKSFAIVDGEKIPLTSEGNLDYSFLIGQEGEVVTDLKPSGKVNINGKIYEVTSTKEYIYTGTYVKVEKVVGSKIIVKSKFYTEDKN